MRHLSVRLFLSLVATVMMLTAAAANDYDSQKYRKFFGASKYYSASIVSRPGNRDSNRYSSSWIYRDFNRGNNYVLRKKIKIIKRCLGQRGNGWGNNGFVRNASFSYGRDPRYGGYHRKLFRFIKFYFRTCGGDDPVSH